MPFNFVHKKDPPHKESGLFPFNLKPILWFIGGKSPDRLFRPVRRDASFLYYECVSNLAQKSENIRF